ncbi:MAG: hypothetical protein LBD02_01940 [Christensenellaceae bacterium]|jgi:hypothetical protein|nr:hypothetical protein [Christensenellaceae bacterium]
MKVSTLMSLFLKKLGHGGTDLEYPDTALDYAPEALSYLNEGYFKALAKLRPVREEEISLDALGCFDPGAFSLPAVSIRYLIRGGRRRRCYLPVKRGMKPCFLPGGKAGETLCVGYEFDPPQLSSDEDEPLLEPEFIHSVLADYAAARVLEARGETAQAGALYGAFERALLLLRPPRGPFENKYKAWEGL